MKKEIRTFTAPKGFVHGSVLSKKPESPGPYLRRRGRHLLRWGAVSSRLQGRVWGAHGWGRRGRWRRDNVLLRRIGHGTRRKARCHKKRTFPLCRFEKCALCVCVFFSYALAAFFFSWGEKDIARTGWRSLEYGAKATSVTTCRRSSSSTCYVSTKRFVSLVSTRKRQTSESPEVIYIFSISIIFLYALYTSFHSLLVKDFR